MRSREKEKKRSHEIREPPLGTGGGLMPRQEGRKKRAPLWRLRFPALVPACVRLPEKTVTASDARCLRKM